MGTDCENLPEAHKLLRGFNAVCRIAAPSLLFKSEAIVHPDFVAQYIDPMECQLSYNPLQMALIWEGLATRDCQMLNQALERRHNIASGCAWVNYMRSHDDIGCEWVGSVHATPRLSEADVASKGRLPTRTRLNWGKRDSTTVVSSTPFSSTAIRAPFPGVFHFRITHGRATVVSAVPPLHSPDSRRARQEPSIVSY
jgi:hypothetical protein